MTPKPYLQYDARLVEEAVLLGISGHPEERMFRRSRDRIYEIENSEVREGAFREFHGRWFLRLQLNRPLALAVDQQCVLKEKTRMCAVVPAISGKDEGADLHGLLGSPDVTGDPGPVIVIKLRPSTFLNEAALLQFLSHELMHIVDMLDPGFGYEPSLPQSGFGPSHDNLVRERYKVLWDTWISGRLARRGWADPTIRDKRWSQFSKTFAFMGADGEARFASLYASERQTHHALVDLAANPASCRERPDGQPQAQPCPLCRFPSYNLVPGTGLDSTVLDEIAADHPGWQPEGGLCDQCADLYRAREMSRTAASMLPGSASE